MIKSRMSLGFFTASSVVLFLGGAGDGAAKSVDFDVLRQNYFACYKNLHALDSHSGVSSYHGPWKFLPIPGGDTESGGESAVVNFQIGGNDNTATIVTSVGAINVEIPPGDYGDGPNKLAIKVPPNGHVLVAEFKTQKLSNGKAVFKGEIKVRNLNESDMDHGKERARDGKITEAFLDSSFNRGDTCNSSFAPKVDQTGCCDPKTDPNSCLHFIDTTQKRVVKGKVEAEGINPGNKQGVRVDTSEFGDHVKELLRKIPDGFGAEVSAVPAGETEAARFRRVQEKKAEYFNALDVCKKLNIVSDKGVNNVDSVKSLIAIKAKTAAESALGASPAAKGQGSIKELAN